MTCSENLKHAYSIGLMCNKGSNAPNSKLREYQVREIRETYKNRNCSAKDFAYKYGISYSTLMYIMNGKLWRHLK
jgi:predicted transcriptional regulator